MRFHWSTVFSKSTILVILIIFLTKHSNAVPSYLQSSSNNLNSFSNEDELNTNFNKLNYIKKASPWHNLNGSWGKRNGGNGIGVTGNDLFDEKYEDFDQVLPLPENSFDELNGYDNQNIMDYEENQGLNEINKRAWNKMNAAWGKRVANNNWNNFKGSWGKREPGWNNLKGLWGKRSQWNKLSSAWGK